MGLHDKTKFYVFIPRQWPYLWERNIKPAGSSPPNALDFLSKFYKETLMHQDIETDAIGLRAKVREVIRAGIYVLTETYVQDFDPNQTALAELQGNSEAYAFEHFLNA